MDWTNNMVIEFLQVFGTEPIIWDPRHPEHKKKHLLAEAWRRINKTLNWQCTIEDLKKKRDSLMAYYRIHLYKIRKLKTSGTIEDDYKTNWFAFDTMNSFLGNIYDSSVSYSPEEGNIERIRSIPDPIPTTDSANGSEYQSDSEYQPKTKRRLQEVIVEVERLNSRPEKGTKECEMYVHLLVHKLMKLDEHDRLVLMNKIDNLVFETTMEVNARQKSDKRVLNNSSNQVLYNTKASLPNQTHSVVEKARARADESSSIIEIEHDVVIKQEI